MATPDEVQRAINDLSDGALLKLSKYASWRVRWVAVPQRQGREGDDLFQEAIRATLEGRRRWNKGLDFVKYMTGAMRSIASHWTTKADPDIVVTASSLTLVRGDGSEMNPLETVPAAGPSPEREALIKDMFTRVEALFADDTVASLVLQGMRDGCSTAEIADCLNVDIKKVEAKKKLIERHVRAAYPEGKGI